MIPSEIFLKVSRKLSRTPVQAMTPSQQMNTLRYVIELLEAEGITLVQREHMGEILKTLALHIDGAAEVPMPNRDFLLTFLRRFGYDVYGDGRWLTNFLQETTSGLSTSES